MRERAKIEQLVCPWVMLLCMAIEHPFDSRYVRIVHILLWSTALVHFTRHLHLFLRNDPLSH